MKNLSKVLALSLAIILALGLAASAAVPTYFGDSLGSDVRADEKLAIDVLGALGMSAGTVAAGADASVNLGGTFNPNAVLTRAEAVTFICNAISGLDAEGLKVYATYASKFNDLAGYEWAKPFIGWAVQRNVTAGTATDKFSPGAKLTVIQALGMIANAHGLNNDKDGVKVEDWKDAVFNASVELKLGTKARTLAYESEVTRKEMALFVYNSLFAKSFTYKPDYSQVINGTSVPRFIRELNVPAWSDSNTLSFLKDGTIVANKFASTAGYSATGTATTTFKPSTGADKAGIEAPFNYVGRKATAIVLNDAIVGYSLGGSNEIFTTTDKVSFSGNKINFGKGEKTYVEDKVEAEAIAGTSNPVKYTLKPQVKAGNTITVYTNYGTNGIVYNEEFATETAAGSGQYTLNTNTIADLKTAIFDKRVDDIICVTDNNGFVTTIYLLQKSIATVGEVKADTIKIGTATVEKKNIANDYSGLKKDDQVLYYQIGANGPYYVFALTAINAAKATLGSGTDLVINGTTYKQGFADGVKSLTRSYLGATFVNKDTNYLVFGGFYLKAELVTAAATTPNYAVITKVNANMTNYVYGTNAANGNVVVDMLLADGTEKKQVYINSAKDKGGAEIKSQEIIGNTLYATFYNTFGSGDVLVTYTKVDGADAAYDIKIALSNANDYEDYDVVAVDKKLSANTLDGVRLDASSVLFVQDLQGNYKVYKTSNITTPALVMAGYITKPVTGQTYANVISVANIFIGTNSPFATTTTTKYAVVAGEAFPSEDGKSTILPVRLAGAYSNGVVNLSLANTKDGEDLYDFSANQVLVVNYDNTTKVLGGVPTIPANGSYAPAIFAAEGNLVTFVNKTSVGTVKEADITTANLFDADLSKFTGNVIYMSDVSGYPKASTNDDGTFKSNVTFILKQPNNSSVTIADGQIADITAVDFENTVDAIIIW